MGKFKLGKIVKKVLPVLSVLPTPLAPIARIATIGMSIADKLKSTRQAVKQESNLPEALPSVSNYVSEPTVALSQQQGGNMPLPAAISGLIGQFGQAIAPAVARGFGGGRRKSRKKKSLSLEEMGKIMVMGQALGKKSPAVTLLTMKAISGRL